MDRPHHHPSEIRGVLWDATIAFLLVSPIATIVGLLPSFPEIFPLTIGILVSAAIVYCLVRFLNRRDDPRYAKRPPDAP